PPTINVTRYASYVQHQVSSIFTQLNQYHVVLEADPILQLTPDALKHIYVHASPGGAAAASSGGTGTPAVGAAAASQAALASTTPSASAASSATPGTAQPVQPLSGSREQIIPLSSFAHIETHATPV